MNFAAFGYHDKEKHFKPGQKGYIKNKNDFAKAVYKIENNLGQVDNNDPIYSAFMVAIGEYIASGQLIKYKLA